MANSLIGRDMAVDLGTANTLVYVRGKGVLVDEPSVVAMNEQTHEILAVGHEAKRMIGRTPDGITAIRPLKDGVIADLDATEQMLRHFIQQVHRRRYFAKPRMIICVPSGVTAVEQRAVKEAGYQAGGRRVYIIEEPMAAAIGAGLPVHEATGNMVVDIGGGTTEVAVISLGGLVTTLSVRTAGDELDQAIVAWMKKEHSLMLGERTAEEIKMTLGSAFPLPQERQAEVRGRDMVSGLPRTVTVSSPEIRRAIEEQLHAIVDAVRTTLDQTPPELAGDIMDRGIVLTGGGALLLGLDERIRHETGMPVHVAARPADLGGPRRRQVRRGVRGAPAGARRGPQAVARWPRSGCDNVKGPSLGRPVTDDGGRTGFGRDRGGSSKVVVGLLIAASLTVITVDAASDDSSPIDPARAVGRQRDRPGGVLGRRGCPAAARDASPTSAPTTACATTWPGSRPRTPSCAPRSSRRRSTATGWPSSTA